MILDLTETPAPDDAEAVLKELTAFNAGEVGPPDRRPLAVFLRESPGAAPRGGLTGFTAWNWLFTGNLWLGPELRGAGWAARLLEAAEAEARSRGCHSAWIDTFNPVARRAYERQGYAVFGELPNFVADRSRFFLQKTLRPAAASA